MKKCCDCKEVLSLECFAKASSRKDGKQDCCRSCMSGRAKQRRTKLKLSECIIPKVKYCAKCSKTKEAAAFYVSVSKSCGLQDYCKECQNRISTSYGQTHAAEAYELNKAYRKRNPEKVRNWDRQAKIKRRRLLATAQYDKGITLDEIYAASEGVCKICNKACERSQASMDHIKPLSRGGDHTRQNLQLAHFNCNSRKGNTYDENRT